MSRQEDAAIHFTKMSAGGNDFLVFDSTGQDVPATTPLNAEFIRKVCARALSVGADGVIAISSAENADVRMTYWNADGGRAALCGNGVRCVARLAAIKGLGRASGMTIRTDTGVLSAGLDGTTPWFRLPLSTPKILDVCLEVTAEGGTVESFSGTVVTAGVPHLVIECEDSHGITPQRLAAIAPRLRYHRELGAEGANVDFVTVASRREVDIRCWERGVEGETLSSGTGCIATAVAMSRAGRCDSEITLRSRAGLASVVRLEVGLSGDVDAVLSGEARIIFTGVLGEEATLGFLA